MLPLEYRLTRKLPCEPFSVSARTCSVSGISFRYIKKDHFDDSKPVIGIIVSKKNAKRAVKRNYIKRVVRNIIVKNNIHSKLPSSVQCGVFILNKDSINEPYDVIESRIKDIIVKLS